MVPRKGEGRSTEAFVVSATLLGKPREIAEQRAGDDAGDRKGFGGLTRCNDRLEDPVSVQTGFPTLGNSGRCLLQVLDRDATESLRVVFGLSFP